jgi:DNA repair exonuclease SbcCD ATPase subunit
MKKYLVVIASVLLFAGCESHKAELAQASRDKDSLMAVVNSKDAVVNDFLGSFNEIQDNLLAITQKENMVASDAAGSEVNKPTKEKIKDQIAIIHDLMDKNKKAIASLSKKLKTANGKSEHLEKMLASLNEQMEQKNRELADLTAKVESLNGTVATLHTNVNDLTAQNEMKARTIEDQTKTIHTAYYTVGTKKQLTDEKVMDKTGGFLGIGKAPVLKSDFDPTAFKQVDITQTSTIPVNSKEATLVTSHPLDSYKLQMENDKVTAIVITDPDKFWKASKYLVVLTN